MEGHYANNNVAGSHTSWRVTGGFAVERPDTGNPAMDLQDQVAATAVLEARPIGTPPYDAADSNGDGTMDLSDAVFLLNFLFLGGEPPCFVPTPVLKTGVGVCLIEGSFTVEPTCTAPENPDHADQDGLIGRLSGLPRRFEFPAHPERTVKDLTTGLVWIEDPLSLPFDRPDLFAAPPPCQPGLVPCDPFDASPCCEPGGPERQAVNRMNWECALRMTENLVFAGISDWRLPNVYELASLLNLGALPVNGDPQLKLPVGPGGAPVFLVDEGAAFVCTTGQVVSFWTSTTSTLGPSVPSINGEGRNEAFVIDFLEGKIHNDEICNDKNGLEPSPTNPIREFSQGAQHYVWPVAGPF
jgi:hypothetical protein